MTLKRYELKGEHFHSALLDSAGCWIDVSRADKQELEHLHKLYGVPQQFLNYALDANEKPRIQEAGDYTLYVLQASHAKEGSTPFDTVPLAIIQTPQHIITVCEHLHTVLLDFKTGRLRGTSTEKPLVFILYILLRVAQRYVRDVQHISGKVEELEQRLEQISLYRPGTDSGTFDYFTEAIVGEAGSSRADYFPSEDDTTLVQGVEGDKNALGYFGFAYYLEEGSKLKALEVDGGNGCVAPTAKTVADGSYAPLSRPLFIYVSKSALAENPNLAGFVEYYLSDEARTLISDTGYVVMPDAT
jgi:CorA-like Mg2+ transporter protein/PBP superfamily domain